MTDTALLAPGFDPECHTYRGATCSHRPAYADHYVAVHLREVPTECPTCDGTKQPEAATCRRCRAAGVV